MDDFLYFVEQEYLLVRNSEARLAKQMVDPWVLFSFL